MQLTIESIERVPLVSKTTGKPFTSVRIKTREHPGKTLSGFANVDNADWEIGDVVEANVEQKGQYLNFSTPKEGAKQPAGDSNRVEAKVDALRNEVKVLGGILTDMRGVLGDILSKVAPATEEDPNFP